MPTPELSEYQCFWIVAKNVVSQVFDSTELEAAIAEYQFRREHEESAPRFLGEQADESLHDLTDSVFSPNQGR
ncbi:hypothetical protein [Halomicronema sp. CCY15110]|uniref:hypothetical protein n=1 Tax=Halomicronema sp. CCY15110 TaxID=2767773 RepID=UPI0019518D68|nr:hypothetical protein [Halomicronema sp. CCY15110]